MEGIRLSLVIPFSSHYQRTSSPRILGVFLEKRCLASEELADGIDWLSVSGRRHAGTLEHGLDAQSCPVGRGLILDQACEDRLGRGRLLVLGHASGCRSGE